MVLRRSESGIGIWREGEREDETAGQAGTAGGRKVSSRKMVTLEHSLDGPRNLSIALEMMVGNEP